MGKPYKGWSFDYMIKPVAEQCNNACVYCYYAQNRSPGSATGTRMPVALAEKLMRDIAAYEQERGSKKAEVTWHGGEPLLAGLDFYDHIFAYQKALPVKFRNAFQTNGELIDRRWCALFKANNCHIGFSLDGPPAINDRQRTGRDGKGTARRALRGMDLCRSHGVGFGGVLCVVTAMSAAHPELILNYFYERGIKVFDFLAAHDVDSSAGRARFCLTPARYAEFMKRVLDWYFAKNDPELEIRTLTNVFDQLFGGRASVCSMKGDACGTFLTIYADGRVLFCDDYNCGRADEIGNVSRETISQIAHGAGFRHLRDGAKGRLAKCRGCPVVSVCNGGCPRDWDENGSFFCPFYEEFYSYCYEKVASVLRQAQC